jgi:Ser/Thr protein kinase RdoA (MazF antagonist)
MSADDATPYANLTPDTVLTAVEALGLECDGRLLALNSYENRVYRVGLVDQAPVVAKFYRPHRWSDEAIREEHAFTIELADAELDVVPPLRIAGETLHHHAGFRFALFRSVGGRAPEPDDRDTLRLLGRTLARLHAVGANGSFAHRARIDVDTFGRAPVAFLLGNDWLPSHLFTPFETLAGRLLERIDALWSERDDLAVLRLHGDCHLGNIMQRDDTIVLVDLDDTMTGPAIQDLWMLLSGEGDDLRRQLDWLLEGYALFRSFSTRELALIEPLRTLRILHHNAWIARRWDDPAFPAAFPWFAENRHWEALIGQMHEQLSALDNPPLLV